MIMPIQLEGETYYSTKEACQFLSVTRQTLDSYREKFNLETRKKGFSTTNYYKLSDLQHIKDERERLK